jgi:predicted acylesterase/phospholipase RssA
MDDRRALSGVRIHFSGSIGHDTNIKVSEFVQKLASRIFAEGGAVIHGSHPSLIEPLRNAAVQYIEADGDIGALTLVRAKKFALTDAHFADIDAQRAYAAVQIVPADTSNDSSSDLTPMREWMADRSDTIICFGGKWWDVNKSKAGVPNELDTMLDLGKPAFIVAGFGGAIASYLKEKPVLLSELKNGLSEGKNREIANETSADHLVELIIGQLKNLPLVQRNLSRILALDGGGLRGAFTAAVLAKWDDMLKAGGDNGLVSHFDLVAGTSTGAILAIGLGLGLAPAKILKFYKEKGPLIFPTNRKIRHFLKSKHDSATLREMLTEVYGEKSMIQQSCSRLVIPTIRAKHGKAEAIVTPHSPDRTAFRSISAVDAALASSAAPTYFEEAHWEGPVTPESFLDGGVWANNPILPALSEAVRHLHIPLDRIDVLSIGTLTSEHNFTEALGKGMAGWALQSTDLFFTAQEHGAMLLAESFLGPTRHLRVNQQTPVEITLDNASAIDEMIARGNDAGKDSFIEVRSRFLDGLHAEKWKSY